MLTFKNNLYWSHEKKPLTNGWMDGWMDVPTGKVSYLYDMEKNIRYRISMDGWIRKTLTYHLNIAIGKQEKNRSIGWICRNQIEFFHWSEWANQMTRLKIFSLVKKDQS